MQGQKLEEWRKLCEQAATEQDPERLLELVERINHLLKDKEQRLFQKRVNQSAAS
jgi:hypothetical protein